MIISGGLNIHKNKINFKKECLIPRMREFFSEFEYLCDDGLQRKTIRDLRLIPTGDAIYTHELIKGRYRGCSFVQGNVRCTETTKDMDGEESTSTVFWGRVIIIGLSVIKEGEVKIFPNRYGLFFNRDGVKLNYNHPVSEKYTIIGSDMIELPKYFLDHVATFGDIFNKYAFYYKIINDRIYIAINGINGLYDVGKGTDTSVETIDEIIKKDSAFFTNLISLIIEANEEEK